MWDLDNTLEYSKYLYFYNYVWKLLILPLFYRLEKYTGQMMPRARQRLNGKSGIQTPTSLVMLSDLTTIQQLSQMPWKLYKN